MLMLYMMNEVMRIGEINENGAKPGDAYTPTYARRV